MTSRADDALVVAPAPPGVSAASAHAVGEAPPISAAVPLVSTAQTEAIVRGPRPRRRRIGPSELEVFPLAIGGHVFGWTADAEATDGILDVYRAAGGNFIDTADSYAGGRSEIMIGNWMRSRRSRDEMVVATKVGKSADDPGVSARAIEAAVHASLRRLRTDRIDLLYLHIDDPEVPFEETLLAVDELIRAGKVRYFGGSHHAGDRLIEARIASAQLQVAHMVALQNQYNLVFRREYEEDLARISGDLRLGVMPRYALASGFLTGKYRSRSDIDRGERGARLGRRITRQGFRVLHALDAVAAQHDATVATIALAWLLAKPNVVAPVVSASDPGQVVDLVTAVGVQLTRHQMAALDRASDWR